MWEECGRMVEEKHQNTSSKYQKNRKEKKDEQSPTHKLIWNLDFVFWNFLQL